MSNQTKTPQRLTTSSGIPVSDNQNALTAGPRGPLLVQDVALFEKHAHFNRERIPERVVHAKASAAFGTLTITHDITKYTRAGVFKPGTQTPMRSEEHTYELQSLMRIPYAVFCLKKKHTHLEPHN